MHRPQSSASPTGPRGTPAAFSLEDPTSFARRRLRQHPDRQGMKIYLYYIGKPRDANANSMAAEYIKRIERYSKCEMREVHPGRFDPWAKHPTATRILLDPAGKIFDSQQFSSLISKAEDEARDL